MKTIAVRVPDDWKERMNKASVCWSDILRRAIEEQLQQSDRAQMLARFVRSKSGKSCARKGAAARSVREDRDGN